MAVVKLAGVIEAPSDISGLKPETTIPERGSDVFVASVSIGFQPSTPSYIKAPGPAAIAVFNSLIRPVVEVSQNISNKDS